MGREYGQIRHDIWSDDDWRSLTRPAQHLYMMLLSDPKLDYCGVTAWHPGKIAQRSGETSGADILIAGAELANGYFIVIDEETEEVLVRSFLRHEPVMKHPKLSVTVTKDFATVGSKKIRAAIVYELNRLKRENPDWSSWEHPSVKTVLRQNSVSARVMDPDLPMGAAQYLGVGQPNGFGVGLGVGLPHATSNGADEFRGALLQERELEPATGTKSNDFAGRQTPSPAPHVSAFRRTGSGA